MADLVIAITDYNSPLDKEGLRFVSHRDKEPQIGDICLLIDLDASNPEPDKLFEIGIVWKIKQGRKGYGFRVKPIAGPQYWSDAVEKAMKV